MHSNSRICSTELAIYGVFFGGLATNKTCTNERTSKQKHKKQLDHELHPSPSFASGYALPRKGQGRHSPKLLSGGLPTAPMAEAADLNGRVLALPSLANSNELAWM